MTAVAGQSANEKLFVLGRLSELTLVLLKHVAD